MPWHENITQSTWNLSTNIHYHEFVLWFLFLGQLFFLSFLFTGTLRNKNIMRRFPNIGYSSVRCLLSPVRSLVGIHINKNTHTATSLSHGITQTQVNQQHCQLFPVCPPVWCSWWWWYLCCLLSVLWQWGVVWLHAHTLLLPLGHAAIRTRRNSKQELNKQSEEWVSSVYCLSLSQDTRGQAV